MQLYIRSKFVLLTSIRYLECYGDVAEDDGDRHLILDDKGTLNVVDGVVCVVYLMTRIRTFVGFAADDKD